MEALGKTYGEQEIFKDLNLDIFEDEILVILGPSGVGKSTLLSTLAGLDCDYTGGIHYDQRITEGIDIPLPVVFQEFDQLLPWYTVGKNITLPMANRLKGEQKALQMQLEKVAAVTGLHDALSKYPNQLSGGMKQRAAIARALMCDGRVLLMDEPFGSLDVVMRRNLQDTILKIKSQYKKTIVFVTHDIDEAVVLADRILIMGHDNTYDIVQMQEGGKERYTQAFDDQVKALIRRVHIQ